MAHVYFQSLCSSNSRRRWRSEGSTDATDDVPRMIRLDRKEKLGMPPV